MKKFFLLCVCACLCIQCSRSGDEANSVAKGNDEVAGVESQSPIVPPAGHETSSTVEELSDETPDAAWYEKVKCLSPAKIFPTDNTSILNTPEALLGKWKLMLNINGNDIVDLSCEEIIYHFKSDLTLSVSNGQKDCSYEYRNYPFCPHCDPWGTRTEPNLTMGYDSVYCSIWQDYMYLLPRWEPDTGWPVGDIRILFLRIE